MYIGGHFITQIALRIFLKLKTLVKGFFEYILPKACGSTSGSGRRRFYCHIRRTIFIVIPSFYSVKRGI